MKILITGGTGLVGSELGKALVEKGHELFVVTRNTKSSSYRCPYPHQAISWDLENYSKELGEIDGVIHLAGANVSDQRWTESYKKKILESREKTTKSLIDAIKKYGKNMKFFVSTSAVGYYGDSDEVLHEDSPSGEGFLAEVCKKWEAPIKDQLGEKIRWVILRVGVVFSEKGGALEKMVAPIQAGVGGALGDGKQYISWIDIDDLVNMYIFAAEQEIRGIYNAVAPDPVQNKELMKIIANQLNRSLLMSVPEFALKIAVGEMAQTLLESQKVSSEKIRKENFKFNYLTARDSIAERVFQLQPFERRKIYEVWLPKSPEEVFTFFSDEKNLEKITPDWLNFYVVGKSTDDIGKGTLIDYKLKLQGMPLRWRTEIDTWDPPNSFSDHQLKGPYKKWHHTHIFKSLGGGTLMKDQVDFSLPLGPLGLLAAGHKVQNDVEKIFRHRNQQIRSHF